MAELNYAKVLFLILKVLELVTKNLAPKHQNQWIIRESAITVSEKVVNQEVDRGILVCGTGIGMSIAANKVKGIRCALVGDTFSAHATREHNDTNVLALGARVIGPGLAEDIVKIWLETAYEGGRHANRVGQITAYEDSQA